MPSLPARARELLDGKNYATVCTLQPDGAPQSSVVWVRRDGDDVLFSTIKGRRKHANLTRDPRISVLIWDAADPYSYVEIRGTASIADDPPGALIDELSHKYHSEPFGARPGERRVIVRVRADRVVVYA